jgi:hypothetical protein
LGIELSSTDIQTLAEEGAVTIALNSCDVGFWIKDKEGKRQFLQPRDSQIVVFQCDSEGDPRKTLDHGGLRATVQKLQ